MSDMDAASFERAVCRNEQWLRRIALGGLVGAALVTVVGLGFRLPQAVWVSTAGALGCGVLLARFALWKCPACGAQLPGRSGSRICPGCDRALPEAQKQ